MLGLFRRHADADGTGHAGAAKAAIAIRILGQVLLMVILGEVERSRIQDLGRDRPVAFGSERLGIGSLRRFGSPALLLAEHVDPGAVLSAGIVALAHPLR